MSIFFLDFHLAFRNIIRQRRRSIIAIASIVFGMTSMILANGFINWMLLEFRELTIRSQLGHLQIVRPNYHDAGKANPYSFLLPIDLPELKESNQQIKAISQRLSFSGLINHGEITLSFIGDGVDPQEEIKFGNALIISAGQNLSAVNQNGIIIGEGLARSLGAKVGDQVVLLANTISGKINALEIPILGLFSTVNKSYDDIAIRLPIGKARHLINTQSSHVWAILLNDTTETDLVLAKLRDKFSQDEFDIVPWYKLADYYNKTIVLFTKQTLGIKIVIILIILLSISNTMTISVMERIGEIGTAMALGIKRSNIMRLFLSEGILIGCFGSLIGLVLGLSLAHVISHIGIPMPPPPSMARGYTGEILVTLDIALESLVLVASTTLIACIYPAWKASRMQIVDALRKIR